MMLLTNISGVNNTAMILKPYKVNIKTQILLQESVEPAKPRSQSLSSNKMKSKSDDMEK